MALNLPRRPDEKLTKSPLKAVACQINFDDLGEVTRGDAQRVQKQLDRSIWPTLRAAQLITGVVAPTGISQQAPRQAWQLQERGDTHSINLRPDNITLETQAYDDWKAFRGRLEVLLQAVDDVFAPSRMLRAGLRFINQLTLDENQSIGSHIIVEHLLGPIGDPYLGPGVSATEQTMLIEVDEDAGLKCILRHGLFPPSDGPRSYLVDIDVNLDVPSSEINTFDPESILDSIDEIHGVAWDIFCVVLTDEYLATLA